MRRKNMKMITVYIPEKYIESMDLMVLEERFPNRSEAIRAAVRDLIRNEYLLNKAIEKNKMKQKIVNSTQINM
jgi:antitoxin ParD1/3/4